MQALEVIKEITGAGDSLAGRLVMYDALSARFYETALAWNPDNPLNGRKPSIVSIDPANYVAGEI
jgi:adenylyltransferase/sulfurtransferase